MSYSLLVNGLKSMFAYDLSYSQIEYFRTAIDLNKKDRATCRVVAEGEA